jgi:hypothetical protein
MTPFLLFLLGMFFGKVGFVGFFRRLFGLVHAFAAADPPLAIGTFFNRHKK